MLDYLKLQRKLIICAKYQVNRMNGVKSGGECPIDSPPLMPSCQESIMDSCSCNVFEIMPFGANCNLNGIKKNLN